ncbi:hypothetical protein EG850_09445 [Gulosibacter macacae]|uniref:Activator of Hsp90 ATPase homologue 1/2-like C-terminal domain-containing protein n=1 Tax=Gulosibacter macacae TaxID=2488791 RepID=A0A3P3VWB5_9MICO|nr:SRPBCC domain-containing protein [Gulosibacter macacae]RRJ86308.1 hypothetical protein EG850_09445 [Gulosibacter macacae]
MTHAQLTTRDGSPAVRLSAQLPVPAGRLWSQSLTPLGLSAWFPFAVDFEPHEGAEVTFTDAEQGIEFTGTITKFVDPEVLSFTFGGGHEVTITLSNDGKHTTFALVEKLINDNEAARSAAGWHQCVAKLERSYGVDSPELDWDTIYDRYAAEGFPVGAPVPGRDDETSIV